MTLRYVDPAATGNNDGTEWTHAWTDMQDALDTAVAGDVVYCRGTQTLSASLEIDTNTGSATGWIKFIGCNASGSVDGTRFVIDGDDTATYCIDHKTNSISYLWFENIEVKQATGIGWNLTGILCNYMMFINCSSNNNGSHGWDNFTQSAHIRCIAYENGGSGFNLPNNGSLIFCRARNNTGNGFDLTAQLRTALIGCIADHNGGIGFKDLYANIVLFNCVADHNTGDGVQMYSISYGINLLIGSRITNHGTIGVDCSSKPIVEGWNYLQDNTGDNFQNATYKQNIPYNGSSSTQEDQGDTESGYVDEDDPEDYNLTGVATLRRTGISIPSS